MSDEILNKLPEDDHVKLALVIRELQSMNKQLGGFGEQINKFIDITDRKVDKEVYLSDREHQSDWNKMLEKRVTGLENDKENREIRSEAKNEEKKKIFGIGKEVWLLIIQVIQLLVIFGFIGSQS